MNRIFNLRTGIIASAFLMLLSCNTSNESTITKCNQDHAIQATYWYQSAAENAALYHQGFNIAKDRIDEIAKMKHTKTPAVVLDIDETIIDNSFFQVESIRKGLPYSDERWSDWVKKEVAKPVPGAVRFIEYALEKNVSVIYITNRDESLRESTLRNLTAIGFPEIPNENYLFKTTGSDKTERRAMMAEKYELLLFMGDNLSDFSAVFDDRSDNNGFGAVEENRDQFGRNFIVFANPTYGDWQKKLLKDGNNVDCIDKKMVNILKN
ncbi:MAG: 5'-nucleotidase, lipoprotein e(P4) family [Salinivirgaceae bacterium]|nr:5'-nucleotidase, lipoprotein e(P4) family [Salinivirgaceae bacterium]MDD4746001.1 5'-nucleotidase, lipoprotein e(P4) family [Salinivirgaceae bacterium]MDY0281552.1 5'-nucleotidase, lipoprotein e(P4) family [Salinivirgaceae bacterium]